MTSATHAQAASSEPGPRGRGASGPTEIPPKGWKDIAFRVFNEFGKDRVMLIAAGVTYYLILALVPALTAIVSIFGLVADPITIQEQFAKFSTFVPGGGMEIIEEQLKRLANQDNAALGFAFVLSVGVSIWSTNAGVKAIFDAMNVAYDEPETRSFVKLTLISLGFTLALIVGAILLIGLLVLLPIALNFDFLGGLPDIVTRLISYAIMAAMVALAIAAIYRYGPDRDRAKWRWITPGAIFATIVIAIASLGFSFYVSNFGSYNATYGSLGALIGFITWIWISTIILIMGAELNAESEKQTRRDSTIGEREQMGSREAEAADTLGARAGDNQTAMEQGGTFAEKDNDDSSNGNRPRSRPRMSLSALAVMVPFAVAAGLLTRR